jgi:hypothetical protein
MNTGSLIDVGILELKEESLQLTHDVDYFLMMKHPNGNSEMYQIF